MFLNTLSGHLEIIRRYPPLAAELARRFTDAPLPGLAEMTTEMTHPNMSISAGEGYVPAVQVAVYDTPRPSGADRARALALTVLNDKGTCRIWYSRGSEGTTVSPVVLGPGSG